MSFTEAPSDQPNELLHAEQRLASARVVVKRFDQVRTQLGGLLHDLRASTPEDRASAPPARQLAFETYVRNTQALVDFYGAVFNQSRNQVHEPSKVLEQQMNGSFAHYVETFDPLHENALSADLQALRGFWAEARTVDGLAAFEPFSKRLGEEIEAFDRQLASIQALEEGDIDEAMQQHLLDVGRQLTVTRDFLHNEQQTWDRKLQGLVQEIGRFMIGTQGPEGAIYAQRLIAKQDKHFEAVTTSVESMLRRDELLTFPAAAKTYGPFDSAARRQAAEIRALEDVEVSAARIAHESGIWLDDLEQAALKARRQAQKNGLDTTERLVLNEIHELREPTALFVYAHPDDETTAGAEVIAHLSELGQRTVLVTATGGEAGRVHTAHLDNPAGHRNFTDLRSQEQVRAAEILGVDVLVRAGLVDAGMRDDPSNHHLRLAGGNRRHLVRVIKAQLEEFRPTVIYTHPPREQQKAYQHPDHLETLDAVLEAVRTFTMENRDTKDFVAPRVLAVSVEDRDRSVTDRFSTSVRDSERAIAARAAYVTQIPSDAPLVQQPPVERTIEYIDVTPNLQRATAKEHSLHT